MNLRSLMTMVVMAFAVIFTSTANAAVIGVNFVGGQNGPNGAGTVTTTAGAVQVANWNNAAGASGNLPNPINDVGAVAATNVNWNSPNTWAATGATPPGGGSATMMSGYLDNFDNQNITVTGLSSDFTGPGYRVLVYFNVDQIAQMGFRATDNLLNTDTRFGRQAGGAGTNFPLGGPNGFIVSTDPVNNFATTTAANVVQLVGFNGSSFTLTGVAGSGAPGSGNRSRINGFQIIGNPAPAIPEPASLTLLGLGGLALARRRRTA